MSDIAQHSMYPSCLGLICFKKFTIRPFFTMNRASVTITKQAIIWRKVILSDNFLWSSVHIEILFQEHNKTFVRIENHYKYLKIVLSRVISVASDEEAPLICFDRWQRFSSSAGRSSQLIDCPLAHVKLTLRHHTVSNYVHYLNYHF